MSLSEVCQMLNVLLLIFDTVELPFTYVKHLLALDLKPLAYDIASKEGFLH